MKDTVLIVLSSVLLLIVYDDDEVPVDTMRKEALEFRFHTLFIDMSFIVMSDSEVEENELMIAVLKSESVIDNEVLTVCIKVIMIKDDLAAAVQAADVEAFVIKIVIREEVRAVDVETSSMKDKIEVEV